MCGIVGYVGQRSVQEILLAGLEKLEYRGYDSAGISIQGEQGLEVVRAVGNLSALKAAVAEQDASAGAVAVLAPPATTGIGHTRWATHGRVTEENAHPHYDPDNRVHVVVNGIVENYMELKTELQGQGAHFTSETDVEVIAHLIANDLDEYGLVEATRRTYNRLRGHYSFVAQSSEEPGVLVGARKECPLIVGRGDDEQFLASGIPAFLAHTRTVQTLEDDELVVLTADGASFMTADGVAVRARDRRRSTGTRTPPRRAATRPSCSRRSTSRRTPSPRRSPTAPCAPTAWTSPSSTTSCCAASSASSSSPAAPPTTRA